MTLDRRFWVRLLLTALGLRILFSLVLIWDWPLVSDANEYSRQAEGFLTAFPGDGQYYWPPGTSYVLAAFYEVLGAGRVAARVAMILLSVGSVAATVLLARRVLHDPRAVRAAGWIMALLPSAVFMPSQPFSFDVTLLGLTLAVLGGFAAYDRSQARWLVLGGLALGLAVVARPGSASVLFALGPLCVLLVVRLWRAGDRARSRALALGGAGFLVAAAALVAFPVVHHHDNGDGLTISVNNEGNLLLGNNPYTPDYKTWHLGQHDFDEFAPDAEAYLEREFTPGGTLEQRRAMREEALDYVEGHPARTAWRTVNRVRAFWGFDYTYSNGLRAEWGAPPLVVAGAAGAIEVAGWVVFGILVLAGIVLGRGLFLPSRALVLGLVALAYELPYAIAFAGGRWHLPLLGVLAPFAAAGLVALGTSPRAALGRLVASRPLLIATVLFLLLQLEYAYFLITTDA